MSALHTTTIIASLALRHPGHHIQHTLSWLSRADDLPLANASFYEAAILDHFDGSVGATPRHWRQRYYVDSRFWCGSGCPVFLYIGGEGPQGPPSPRLYIWTLAEKHGALLVALEHRFYGESRPTADLSTANLQYLTSSQALADLARFRSMISAYQPGVTDTSSSPPLVLPASPNASKWVSFGGSYPGNLATWLKAKYPALVDGTVGSSAPVLAHYDFAQYAQVVGAALAYTSIGGSTSCAKAVTAGVTALANASAAQLASCASRDAKRGAAPCTLPVALRPCTAPRGKLDRSTYYANIMGNFQGAVQYNLEGRPPYVSDVCDTIAQAGGADAPLEALAAATALFATNVSAPQCVGASFATDMIGELNNISFSAVGCNLACNSSRQWIWQSCNEFGYFQTATGANQPFRAFGGAIDAAAAGNAVCLAAFGLSEYKGPRSDASGLNALTTYGGRHISVANITMPNGNMDPWHALGVVNSTDAFYDAGADTAGSLGSQQTVPGVSVVELDGTAHCRDMYAPGAFASLDPPIVDTPSVVWAHARIGADVARYVA